MAIHLTFDSTALEDVRARIDALGGFQTDMLADEIGAVIEAATQERIAATKEGPHGEVWPAWSPRYRKTRAARHSLLVSEGDLRESYQAYSRRGGVTVGSPLIYAAIHHAGSDKASGRGSGVPARPALGVSPQDADDIEAIVADRLRELLA
jgi:phage virion morphogenesis protein